MTAGFRIRTQWDRLDRALVEDFAQLPVSVVSDVMSRLVAGGTALRPMHRRGVLAGAALTVKTRPGDNLMLHKAIEMAELGDVIVVDAGGDVTNSLMGELMLTHAIKRGVGRNSCSTGQFATPLRFLNAISQSTRLALPIAGPYRDGPGEIGLPINIGGMTVEPGDLILGDLDGVVSVRRADLEVVLAGARKKHVAEQLQMQQTEDATVDKSWIDTVLAQKGCVYL